MDQGIKIPALFDRYLLIAIFGLLMIGLLMVSSASMVVAEQHYHESFYFLYRQAIFAVFGLLLMFSLVHIPMNIWNKTSAFLLFCSFLLLILVLIPGIGRIVNGSRRWIGWGSVGLQVSEWAKLVVILYLGGYLVRQEASVRNTLKGFIKPILILISLSVLILSEPDLGAVIVIFSTAMFMLFLSGAQWRYFIFLSILLLAAVVLLIFFAPYRAHRFSSFLDPWQNAFGSGYQLTQSLIAFGRGGLWGAGLGQSVQKLFYLPEAHTDFLFAVLAEELGFLGVLLVIGLFILLFIRGFLIARRAQQRGALYSAYVAYGITVWLGLQAIINMGVNIGIFPTKGLTLPLLSYGGSSLLINCMALGILLRIDYEGRLLVLGLSENIEKIGKIFK